MRSATKVSPSARATRRGAKTALILPDIATCAALPARRFSSPATAATAIPSPTAPTAARASPSSRSLPYDRPNTSMKKFKMCPAVRARIPRSRRPPFSRAAERLPELRPAARVVGRERQRPRPHDDALRRAAEEVRDGKIVALKGLGGFQLIADARNESVVKRLRKRKRRSEKPFALMYPSLDLVREHCRISELEERLLLSPEAPIVLLQRWSPPLAPSIAPGNPNLGVMLPSTPLHHLLMRELGFPRRRHQRQSQRRTDLHRRARGPGPPRRASPIFSWSTTAPSCGRWTIRSCASCAGAKWSCAARAAMRRCRSI